MSIQYTFTKHFHVPDAVLGARNTEIDRLHALKLIVME